MTEKIESHRASIPAVPEGSPRPLWSVMIPTHNCAHYLVQSLTSVLAQAPGPAQMQIEVVDDCSTLDDPAAIVAELGQGRVGFYRQPENVGHLRNFQTCLERSRGRWVHLLHGDDYVLAGFYSRLELAFAATPQPGAAFCRQIFVDERGRPEHLSPLEQPDRGILNNWLERIAVGQRLQTPAIVVGRQVYEQLGGFDCRLKWVEDWEMWVRLAAHYPVWYEPEPLAAYRVHPGSNSSHLIRTGENIRDVRRAVSLIKPYLPPSQADKLTKVALERWAITALYGAKSAALAGDRRTAVNQIKEALRCRVSLPVISRALYYSILLLGSRNGPKN